MSSRTEREFLADILEAVRRAEAYVADMDYEEFLADTKTQDAVIRTLEIMGEATKRLSAELRQQHPSVPWKNMAGGHSRKKITHGRNASALEWLWLFYSEWIFYFLEKPVCATS